MADFAAALTPIASIIASMVTIALMIQVLRQSKAIGAQGALIEARQIATHKLVDGVAHDLAKAKKSQSTAEIGQASAEGFTAGEAAQRERGDGRADGKDEVVEAVVAVGTTLHSDHLEVARRIDAARDAAAPRPRRKPKAPPAL